MYLFIKYYINFYYFNSILLLFIFNNILCETEKMLPRLRKTNLRTKLAKSLNIKLYKVTSKVLQVLMKLFSYLTPSLHEEELQQKKVIRSVLLDIWVIY